MNYDYAITQSPRYAGIEKFDINNGKGFGVTFFFQGCPHRCHGCHNPETWDFSGGKPFTASVMYNLFSTLNDQNITRLTLSGGEPFAKENEELALTIAARFKHLYPTKTLWAYSGYTFESICDSANRRLLDYCDVLVDGRYLDWMRDVSLAFRGSSNQRIIDVQRSLRANKPILYSID